MKSGVLAAHDPAAFHHLGEDAMVVAPPTLLGSMLGLERHHVLGDVDRLPEVPAEPEGDADIELVEVLVTTGVSSACQLGSGGRVTALRRASGARAAASR